ncbi:ASCH domain [Dillenia turbinata]|uniref:ASCH domain n=1 Tax=Dillenia turbinata TaxID=194707 RepID=A0AAN8Z7R7_9MAGN
MKGSCSKSGGNDKNPCLTLHQPWASLLVYGIKRVEGRSWPSPVQGRLWIHAASKVPDPATIKAMEDFYREIYAVNGITNLRFPKHYPISRLLGCVEVVGCVKCEELICWEEVRLEGQTDFCWLCEQPQKLIIPIEMRGYQRVYNLEKKIYDAAVRGLVPVESPLPVKFPLPDPRDPFSLKPGSLASKLEGSKASNLEKSEGLNAAISGARTAATQFAKKNSSGAITVQEKPISTSTRSRKNFQRLDAKGRSERGEVGRESEPMDEAEREIDLRRESNQDELIDRKRKRVALI